MSQTSANGDEKEEHDGECDDAACVKAGADLGPGGLSVVVDLSRGEEKYAGEAESACE